MDTNKSLDEKIKIDNNLSNRYIDLDPNGYFIIKVDLDENNIILEHFLNNINDDGYALDPETNEPIRCDSQNKRVCNEFFEGIENILKSSIKRKDFFIKNISKNKFDIYSGPLHIVSFIPNRLEPEDSD